MQIQPIEMQTEPLTEFRYLRVVRTGGFAGVHDELLVDDAFRAKVHNHWYGPHERELDATVGEDLLHALGALAARGDDPVDGRRGRDTYRYEIELRYDGVTLHLTVDQLAADEAIHGVLAIATKLIEERAGA